MNEVVVLAGAQSHVLGIYSRLEDQCTGRGDRFYEDFLEACDFLVRHPEIAPKYDERFRKYLLRKWHIGLFYTITGNRILISAVFDLRQNPETIRRFLKPV